MSKAKRKNRKVGAKSKSRRVPFRGQPMGYGGLWPADHARDHRRSSIRLHPVVELGDGEVGYGMDPYRYDDCFQAAIATATQVPIEQVPDLCLDKRLRLREEPAEINRQAWDKIERWAERRGLRLVFHERLPAPRRRWIGVIREPNASGPFEDHALVVCHDKAIFDPGCTVKPLPGTRYRGYDMDYPPSMWLGGSVSTERSSNADSLGSTRRWSGCRRATWRPSGHSRPRLFRTDRGTGYGSRRRGRVSHGRGPEEGDESRREEGV